MNSNPLYSSPADRPRIGVVVVWRESGSSLYDWLSDLARVERCRELTVVVVAPPDAVPAGLALPGLPTLQHVEASPAESPGALRRSGMAAANADIVLFTDAEEIGFIGRLERVMQNAGVVGGAPHRPRADGRAVRPELSFAHVTVGTAPPFDL